jgi:hypothetical protein
VQFEEIRSQLAFEERRYDELPEELELEEISGATWYVEDLFGEEPESYLHADGGETLPGDICLHRPDDFGYYVIDGDLTVEGALCLSVWDTTNVVIVAGDINAEGLVLDADVQLYVLGETHLNGPLISSLSDAGYALFEGPVTATGRFELGSGETVFDSGAPDLQEMLDDEFIEYEDLLERLDSGGLL